ncbi:hypothetical protein ACFO0M_00880 [Micromonospora mangrovi]|uniref:Helicase XPB/Ssl2 N-terminal domain-containing protein n=2 Tax=Micromonospora TaxID=1873 RepID=A0AAU7MD93_9ACTN
MGRPYCTGKDIFSEVIGRASREQLWKRIPVVHAMGLLSGMLRDLDLGDPPTEAVEAGWASSLPEPAGARARAAIRSGRRLLPPQLLLVALKEALRFCPTGNARDDLVGLDLVLQAVWSIADELGQFRDAGEPRWGGLKASLAAELMANSYFNITAYPLPLIARTHAVWRSGWARSVKPQLQARAGGQPAELFAQATRCSLDDFLGVALHLWVQAQQHRYLTFPPEFFRRIGIAPAAVDRFLSATSVALDDLREYAAGHDAIQHPWDFNELRRRPIVRLPNGSVQVIRLGYVLERAFGQVPEFDVRDHLRTLDGGTNLTVKGGREEAFRSALNTQFEHSVGDVLRRIFPATGRLGRLYTEHDMWSAWGTPSRKPKVCDWVVDCGHMWLCLDATNRRLSQPVAGGLADPTELDREVNAVLAHHKASQIASTIRHLTAQLPQLTSRNLLPGTRFVPLIVIPEDGLPWNPAVHRRVQEILAASGTLQTSRATPLGVITVDDLGLVERAVEDGANAGDLLSRWRSEGPEVPLQRFLHTRGMPLRRPRREVETFERLTDELLDRMTGYQDGVTGS